MWLATIKMVENIKVDMNTSNFLWLEENIEWLAQQHAAFMAGWKDSDVLESNEEEAPKNSCRSFCILGFTQNR